MSWVYRNLRYIRSNVVGAMYNMRRIVLGVYRNLRYIIASSDNMISLCEAKRNRRPRVLFRFNVASRPHKPSGLLGTGSPGRPPRLSPSS